MATSTPPPPSQPTGKDRKPPSYWNQPPPPPTDTTLDPAQRNAYDAILQMLTQFGLQSLAPKILGFIQQGYDDSTINYELQQTQEWKTRFAANEVRAKKGLSVLSPAEYIATERAYGQVLRKWGLPAGFYDQTTDFEKFLENDMSASELDQRAQAASDFVNQASSAEMNYYKQHYSTGEILAYALNPDVAAPLIQKRLEASRIGGTAQNQGIGIDTSQAEDLANLGVTADQARQGFGLIAQEQPALNKLGDIYGGGLTTQELIDATFKSSADASQKVKKLASKERASFGGSTSTQASTLATENNF